jgi:hypothetical protein
MAFLRRDRGQSPLLTMLSKADKGKNSITGSSGGLAWLFRNVLETLDVGASKWTKMMADYLADKRNIPDNNVDLASVRGNIVKDLTRDHQSWKTFLKAMRFANPDKATLYLVIEKNGVKYEIPGLELPVGKRDHWTTDSSDEEGYDHDSSDDEQPGGNYESNQVNTKNRPTNKTGLV